MSKRLTQEEVIRRCIDKHGDKYDYSLLQYKGVHEKVKIICSKHGLFEQTAKDHQNGRGCGSCANNKPLTTKQFIEKSKIIHNNTFDYSRTIYIRSVKKVKIICKEHGEFLQTPNNHLSGSGCELCSPKIAGKIKRKVN